MAVGLRGPFDKPFPGGFGGLNVFEIAALAPIALATYMVLTVDGLTDQLSFGGEHQGLFFTGAFEQNKSPVEGVPACRGLIELAWGNAGKRTGSSKHEKNHITQVPIKGGVDQP